MVYMLNPDISVLFSSQNNTFLHPLEATLEAKISSEWLSDSLPVNQLREYRVHIEDTQSF